MERIGGVVCLDFLNTVDAWPAPTRDDLLSADDLSRWAAGGGLPLTRRPTRADVAAARALRDRLYDVFSPVVDGRPPDADGVLDLLAAAAASRRPAVTPDPVTSRLDLTWPAPMSPDELRSTVAFSAVSLLVRGPLTRVKGCATCGWFFLDTSRNGTRRWCSMLYCGSRAKARRYAASRRSAGQAPPE